MRVGISVLAAKDIAALTLKLTCQCHLFSALPTPILLFLNFDLGRSHKNESR